MPKPSNSTTSGKPKRPPLVDPPTRDEILALPQWTRVAYCARVARRLLPLVRYWETTVPPEYKYLLAAPKRLRGLRSCVHQVEQAAAHAKVRSENALYDARGEASDAAAHAEFAAQLAKRKRKSPQYA